MNFAQVQLAVLCNRAISKSIALPLDPDSSAPLSPALNTAARPERLDTQSVQGAWTRQGPVFVLRERGRLACT